MVRKEYCADPSFAALLEARRLGTAMAAMIPMIAIVMSNSINEKPALVWAAVVVVNLGLLLIAIISLPLNCQRLEKVDLAYCIHTYKHYANRSRSVKFQLSFTFVQF